MYYAERAELMRTIKELNDSYNNKKIDFDTWNEQTDRYHKMFKHYDNMEKLHEIHKNNKSVVINPKMVEPSKPKTPKLSDSLPDALQHYDEAVKYLKIAKNYSVQYFGQCVPKNAIYGRVSKNVYIYVTDFQQFYVNKWTRFNVYILDTRSQDGRFHKTIIKKHSRLYNDICAIIEYHNMKDIKVEHQLMMGRINKPEERKVPQSIYNANPRQLLTSRAADYGAGITEVDACRPHRILDSERPVKKPFDSKFFERARSYADEAYIRKYAK